MIKKDFKVLDSLTYENREKFINTMVRSYFSTTENGEEVFTPYNKHIMLKICFAMFFIDGVEFEEEDDMLELIDTDDELSRAYSDFTERSNPYLWDMQNDITEIVEFKKQQIIQKNSNVNKYLEELLKEQIETMKLQKKILKDADKINKQYSKEEIMRITDASEKLSEKLKDVEVQKGLVQSIKKPTDHKKSTRNK